MRSFFAGVLLMVLALVAPITLVVLALVWLLQPNAQPVQYVLLDSEPPVGEDVECLIDAAPNVERLR